MTKLTLLLASVALAATAGVALADSHETDSMEGMDHSGMTMTAEDPGMQALMESMNTMMTTMPMESAGDIDADFIRMMIPHHQSAIDMARVELEQGDDEETRAMAEQIITAQEAEIAELQAMLERMGVAAE